MFFTDHRIEAVSQLGLFIREFVSGKSISNGLEDLSDELKTAVNQSFRHNGWFIEQNITQALEAWGEQLTVENLEGLAYSRRWSNDNQSQPCGYCYGRKYSSGRFT